MNSEHWLLLNGQSFSGQYGGGAQSREHAFRLNAVGVSFVFVDPDGYGVIEAGKLSYHNRFTCPNWKRKIATLFRGVSLPSSSPYINRKAVLNFLTTQPFSKVICFGSEGALLSIKLGLEKKVSAVFWHNIEWKRYLELVFSKTRLSTRIQYLFNAINAGRAELNMLKNCRLHIALCQADLRWLKLRITKTAFVVEIPPFTISHPEDDSAFTIDLKTPFLTVGNWTMDHNRTALLQALKKGHIAPNTLTIAGIIHNKDRVSFIKQGIHVLGPLLGGTLTRVMRDAKVYIVLGALKTGFQTKLLDGAAYSGCVRAVPQNLCYPSWMQPFFEECVSFKALFSSDKLHEKKILLANSNLEWESLRNLIISN